MIRTRASSSAREPAIPSLGLLIRTWTRYSEPGQSRPHAEQRVNMRNRGFTCGTGGTAVHQTHYITRGPAIPNPGHLIRTWTRYSEPGQHRPHAEQRVNMRNRGSMCGTGGTAVHQTRYITREPAIPNPGLLIRTWTRYSEPGRPRPHAEQRVNMRNRGFTCGTATGGPAWGRPSCMPARRSRALWALRVSDAGLQQSLRGSCPWRGRRGLPRVPRRRCPRASRPKR